MEEEKKKKNKNKKKKNKQTKAAHDLPVPVPSTATAALDTDTASYQGESRSSQQHYESGVTCPVPADGIGQITQDNSMSQIPQNNEAVHLANGTSDRNSSKDFIANLHDDDTRLQNQVTELRNSRKHLSQENEKLRTDITALTSRIQDLESSLHNPLQLRETPKVSAEIEDLNSQIEATCALVGKLMTENAELVEKVTELYIKLDRCTAKTWDPPSAGLSGPVVPHVDTAGNDKFVVSKSFREALVEDERPIHHDYKDLGYVAAYTNSSETSVSKEIMQIPLVDENKFKTLRHNV